MNAQQPTTAGDYELKYWNETERSLDRIEALGEAEYKDTVKETIQWIDESEMVDDGPPNPFMSEVARLDTVSDLQAWVKYTGRDAGAFFKMVIFNIEPTLSPQEKQDYVSMVTSQINIRALRFDSLSATEDRLFDGHHIFYKLTELSLVLDIQGMDHLYGVAKYCPCLSVLVITNSCPSWGVGGPQATFHTVQVLVLNGRSIVENMPLQMLLFPHLRKLKFTHTTAGADNIDRFLSANRTVKDLFILNHPSKEPPNFPGCVPLHLRDMKSLSIDLHGWRPCPAPLGQRAAFNIESLDLRYKQETRSNVTWITQFEFPRLKSIKCQAGDLNMIASLFPSLQAKGKITSIA